MYLEPPSIGCLSSVSKLDVPVHTSTILSMHPCYDEQHSESLSTSAANWRGPSAEVGDAWRNQLVGRPITALSSRRAYTSASLTIGSVAVSLHLAAPSLSLYKHP